MEALLCAAVGEKGEGGNVVELNPLWIAGKPYVFANDPSSDTKRKRRVP